jgi:uncharacterized Fe-S cluster protein YjdI
MQSAWFNNHLAGGPRVRARCPDVRGTIGRRVQAPGAYPQRCRHFAECLRGLPEVFNARHRPWIAPDAASAALVAEVILRCPSRALHYQAPGTPAEQPEVPTTIRAVDRGPFLVRGDLRIYAADGSVTDTRAALCRCTRSARQPFCDAAYEAPEPPGLPGRAEEQ